MPTYQPRRRSHFVLAHLEAGPCAFSDLARAVDDAMQTSRSKAYWVVDALIDDGFVSLSDGDYSLTRDGARALARLRSGEAIDTRPVTSVRVFVREARA